MESAKKADARMGWQAKRRVLFDREQGRNAALTEDLEFFASPPTISLFAVAHALLIAESPSARRSPAETLN